MWSFLLISLLVLCYFKLKKIYNYWNEKGVPFVKPTYLLGNLGETALRKYHIADNVQHIYETQPEKRYLGFYQFIQPVLLIRDPELIKQITIKDFESFPDHNATAPPEIDTLWSKNLFNLASQDGWHALRATISPAFTSSKMRQLFVLMQECSKEYVSYLKTREGTITMEMKDAFSRYATDVIGSTAFGINCNSIKDQNNEFYLMGKKISDFSGIKGLKFLVYSTSPLLARIFRLRIIGEDVGHFFRNVIKETLKVRTEKNIVRPDIIHLLMEAQKEDLDENVENVKDAGFATVEDYQITKFNKKNKPTITDEYITATAVAFFFAGFDTISTLIAYVTYELAVNSDTQEKLYVEVSETLANCNGHITYERLLAMKYLDNVISECLRLHPPAFFIDRKCVKPYIVESKNQDESTILIDEDTKIWIPVRAIQRDAKYYSDPEKFDPERFNDDNKHNIKPFTYMPFGLGPRNCLGSRFALLEIKIIIVDILSNFKLVPTEKTVIPIKLGTTKGNLLPENGLWVGLVRRT